MVLSKKKLILQTLSLTGGGGRRLFTASAKSTCFHQCHTIPYFVVPETFNLKLSLLMMIAMMRDDDCGAQVPLLWAIKGHAG